MMPSVPSLPMKRCFRSKPALFFIILFRLVIRCRRAAPLPGRAPCRAPCRSGSRGCRRRWSTGCRRSRTSRARRGRAGRRSRPASAACCTALERRAGAHRHRRRGRVDLFDADQALQRQRDLVRRGAGAAAQAGQAALRDHGHAVRDGRCASRCHTRPDRRAHHRERRCSAAGRCSRCGCAPARRRRRAPRRGRAPPAVRRARRLPERQWP